MKSGGSAVPCTAPHPGLGGCSAGPHVPWVLVWSRPRGCWWPHAGCALQGPVVLRQDSKKCVCTFPSVSTREGLQGTTAAGCPCFQELPVPGFGLAPCTGTDPTLLNPVLPGFLRAALLLLAPCPWLWPTHGTLSAALGISGGFCKMHIDCGVGWKTLRAEHCPR